MSSIKDLSDDTQVLPSFLQSTLETSDGRTFSLLQALTDFRECHDGTPKESRILFVCKETTPGSMNTDEYVAKIKVQAPSPYESMTADDSGPSTTTHAEQLALKRFSEANFISSPHLVAFVQMTQGSCGPLPGGYITSIIMTKMPGLNLLDYRYWSIGFAERTRIQDHFIAALKSLWRLGIAPTDRALRNILWEAETERLSIVDFESWERPSGRAMDEQKELQQWGLAQRPPPGTWIDEWKLHF